MNFKKFRTGRPFVDGVLVILLLLLTFRIAPLLTLPWWASNGQSAYPQKLLLEEVSRRNVKDHSDFKYVDESSGEAELVFKVNFPAQDFVPGHSNKLNAAGHVSGPNSYIKVAIINSKGTESEVVQFQNGPSEVSIDLGPNPPTQLKIYMKSVGGWTNLYSVKLYSGSEIAFSHTEKYALQIFGIVFALILGVYARSNILGTSGYSTIPSYLKTYLIASGLAILLVFIRDIFILVKVIRAATAHPLQMALGMIFLWALSAAIKMSLDFMYGKDDRSSPKLVFLTLALLFAFGILFFANTNPAGDGAEYFSWIRSLVIDHNFEFSNESEYVLAHGWREAVFGISPTRVLTPILWIPGYFLVHCATKIFNYFGFNFIRDGWSLPYELSITFSSILMTAIGILFIFKALEKFYGRSLATAATSLLMLGSPIFTWTFIHPSYVHAGDFFITSIVLSFWVTLQIDRSYSDRRLFYFVGLIGVSGLAREQNLVFLFLAFFEVIRRPWNLHSQIKRASWSLAGLICGLILPYLIIKGFLPKTESYLNSHPLTFNYDAFLSIFFSTVNGLVTTTPLVSIGIGFALIGTVKKKIDPVLKRILGLLLVNFILCVVCLSLYFDKETLEANLGQRYLINFSMLFAMGIAETLKWCKNLRERRKIALLFIYASIFHFIFLNIRYMAQTLPYLRKGATFPDFFAHQFDTDAGFIGWAINNKIIWDQRKLVAWILSPTFEFLNSNLVVTISFLLVIIGVIWIKGRAVKINQDV